MCAGCINCLAEMHAHANTVAGLIAHLQIVNAMAHVCAVTTWTALCRRG